MKIRTMVRHLREGVRNIVRNGLMSVASIASIAISLFILGVFVILALNMNYLADQLESKVEIRVFLEVNLGQEQIEQLSEEITNIPQVSKLTFISKEEGLELLREKLGEEGSKILEGQEGDDNPLPDSFTVEVFDPQTIAEAAAQIEQLGEGHPIPQITDVQYGEGMVENLFKVTNIVRNIGLVFVVGLALTAMFLIANTIKLTILNRQREISIMKLVGATNGFIRWPFFVEGALLGLIGTMIPIALLLFGYERLIVLTKLDLGLLLIELVPMYELAWLVSYLLLGIGLVIGIWGSIISVRKYLRV